MTKKALTTLLLITLLLSAVSCGSSTTTETTADTTSDTVVPVETEPELVGRDAVLNDLPADLDFQGKTVTVLTRSEEGFREEFYAEEQNGEILNDTVFERDSYVREKLNITTDVISRAGDYNNRSTFMNTVASEVMADGDSYQVISYYAYAAPSMASQGILLNLYDVELLNLEKPWWHQSFIENATIFGKLYTVGGDINLTTVSYRSALFFNQRLVGEFIEDDLYSLVDEGKWTLDTFFNLARGIFVDLDGDGTNGEFDLLGWTFGGYDPIFTGCGGMYTEKQDDGSYKWNYYTEKNNDIIEKVHEMISENCVFYKDNYTNNDTFKNGLRVFYNANLNLTDILRDMEDDYGILPYPKYDETQDMYYSCANDNYSLIMLPLSCKDTKMAGAFLELMGDYSYKHLTPAYFEVAMKSKYLRDDDSSRMFDIIMEGARYDFAVINTSVVGDPVFITRDSMQGKGGNFASKYAAQENSLTTKLNDLIETYRSH